MQEHFGKRGRMVAIVILVGAGFIGLLWAWNTLAELFGWPVAEARHLLAALIVAGGLRFALLPGTGRKVYTHDH